MVGGAGAEHGAEGHLPDGVREDLVNLKPDLKKAKIEHNTTFERVRGVLERF